MASVFHDGPNNSTKFTTCCSTAICDDEQKCPRCKKDVYPFFEHMTDEEREYAAGGYYHHNTRIARDKAARGKAG